MHKAILLSLLLLCSGILSAKEQNPQGFLWENVPSKANKKSKKSAPTVPLSSLSPTEQVKVLRGYTMNALYMLDLNPTPQNAYKYLLWEQYWKKQATKVKQSMQVAYLNHPEIDYMVRHPASSNALKVIRKQQNQRERQAVSALAKNYGIFFFYRGKNTLDAQYALAIRDFATMHRITILPVSMDGKVLEGFPKSKINQGQAQAMGVKALPALMLVNPKSHQAKPLAYGMLAQDELAHRFLMVATQFKGGDHE